MTIQFLEFMFAFVMLLFRVARFFWLRWDTIAMRTYMYLDIHDMCAYRMPTRLS